ncbi:MAG: hypothetical protein RR719_09470 [Akkermansia sp.]
MYKQGNVVEQNMQKARQGLKRAEDQGNEEAKKILEQMIIHGKTGWLSALPESS